MKLVQLTVSKMPLDIIMKDYLSELSVIVSKKYQCLYAILIWFGLVFLSCASIHFLSKAIFMMCVCLYRWQ